VSHFQPSLHRVRGGIETRYAKVEEAFDWEIGIVCSAEIERRTFRKLPVVHRVAGQFTALLLTRAPSRLAALRRISCEDVDSRLQLLLLVEPSGPGQSKRPFFPV
jgi:hypothetical protein